MWKFIFFSLAFSASLPAACIAVEGEQIHASDVAKVDPAFKALSPDLFLTYAPTAGHQRTISIAELERWRSANHISSAINEAICFERASQFLSSTIVGDVIRATVGSQFPKAQLKVIDVCHCPAPAGNIQFPISGAAPANLNNPDMPILWRGQVTQGNQSYPIWARVVFTQPTVLVRATRNLQLGQLVKEDDIEEVTATASPLLVPSPENKAAFVGKTLRRPLSLHQYLFREMVTDASVVRKGSLVEVAIFNGSMVLKLQATAESNANPGEQAIFTNPFGMKRFQATVTGSGKAEIHLGLSGGPDKTENNEHIATTSSKGTL